VVETIESALKTGLARSDIAILYRSNAQSRVLEEACCASASRTASMAASASSSAPKSRTPWPTCACSKAAATMPRWSG
jgi:hypothetical protein